MAPIALTPIFSLRAEEHRYHDASHNDEHEWNEHENKAYRIWLKDNHRKYKSFGAIREEERQSYWRWRHDHDDARLKIVIK